MNIKGRYVTTLERNHEMVKRNKDMTLMQLLSYLNANKVNNATFILTNMEVKWEKGNEAFGIVEGNEGICWGQKVKKSSKMGPITLNF